MPLNFSVRGDSPSANNASLNVQNTNTFPATDVTFTAQTDGDEKLEFNDGNPDKDTFITVDGVTYEFIVNYTGTLPNINKLSNVNGNDLRGEEVMNITIVGPGPLDGQRIFFLTDPDSPIDINDMDAFPNGAIPITTLVEDCFVAGAMIQTPNGPRAVETLQAGVEVTTAGGGKAILRWVGHRKAQSSRLELHRRPVGVPHSLFGGPTDGVLWLSPLHRVQITDPTLDRLFAKPTSLVAARDLPGLQVWHGGDIHYVHLLCDDHQIVLADGIPVETLYPPRLPMTLLASDDPLELEEAATTTPFARPTLTRKEAALWRSETRIGRLQPA